MSSNQVIVKLNPFTCLPFSRNTNDYCSSPNAPTCQNDAKLHFSSLVVVNGWRTDNKSRSCGLNSVNRPKTMFGFTSRSMYGVDRENMLVGIRAENSPSWSSEFRLHYLEERDEKALSSRIVALSRMNKIRSAFELFKSMEFSGLKPNLHACNSMLSCFFRNNMLELALEVFEFMKSNGITSAHSFSLVFKAVAKRQGSVLALRMFWELEDEIGVKEGFDAVVYNTILSVCAKENEWLEMKRIWSVMKKNGHHGTAVTYRVLVCTFVRSGEYQLAIEAYKEMVQVEVRPSEDAMQAIIGACSKEGEWDLALRVFEDMLKSDLKPNLVACNTLINSLGKARRVELAFRVYSHMKLLGHSPDAYTWNSLLVALYRATQPADALHLFDDIVKNESSVLNIELFNTALMCCQKLRSWEKALQLLWKMEDSGMSVSTLTYNLVLGACEAARKPKIALQVYEHMINQNFSPDTFTYLTLIRICVWGSLWVELEEILQLMKPNVSLYNAAIHGMCLRGKIESAKRLYMKMKEFGLVPDGKTRALMLQHMKKGSTRNYQIR